MSNEVDEIVNELKNISLENNPEQTLLVLNKIIESEPKDYNDINLTSKLLALFQTDDLQIKIQVAKCIAELTKTEQNRLNFTNTDTIKNLINNLLKYDNTDLLIQICRALGNLCYLNDDARNIIVSLNGDETMINMLDIKIKFNDEIDLQFAKVRCGLISNYLLGGEQVSKRALDLKLIEKIQTVMEYCIEDVEKTEDILLNILPPLSILTENISDLNFDPKINEYLSKILAGSTNPDLGEMCLELLHYQAENDEVKFLLAKEGLCETIYNLLEKYKTFASSSEARSLMKLACDLIVLILTGDDSMNYLYKTSLLKYMEDWLDSYEVDLLTTGVLALGNFARTDIHCIDMVENGIMKKLLEILSKNNGVDDDMRLQHALLSALRNLVIPKANKAAVVEAGLVKTILPMLEIHQPPVVFKLLGTLRMTVDGQDTLALELLENKTLINQLVQWSKSSEVPGVTGESLRLMAWLIKHGFQLKKEQSTDITSIDSKSLKEFINTDDAVASMVNMLTSQHLVMQNEALIALSIIATVFSSKNQTDVNLDDLFIKCDLGQKITELITKCSDNMTKEIVENLQTFITILRVSEKLETHLNKYNIDELLKSIPILTEYCTL